MAASEAEEPDLSVEPATEHATEDAMGALHGTVAKVLTLAVATMPTPQYLGAAIAFLKNNNITASPSKNKDLAALKESLGKRRRSGQLSKADLDNAAAEFDRMNGGNGMMQ